MFTVPWSTFLRTHNVFPRFSFCIIYKIIIIRYNHFISRFAYFVCTRIAAYGDSYRTIRLKYNYYKFKFREKSRLSNGVCTDT